MLVDLTQFIICRGGYHYLVYLVGIEYVYAVFDDRIRYLEIWMCFRMTLPVEQV